MQQTMMEQNIKIIEPSKNLRALGRNALTGKWKVAILAVIVYQLCMELPTVVLNSLFGTKPGLYKMNAGSNLSVYSEIYNSIPSQSFLASIYVLLVTGAFTLGMAIFFLAVFRRHQVGVLDIFLGFEKFGKALGLMLFQGVFILLWSLLFVVPGIIAALRYSQAFFILADDPSKSIRQCMDESKAMMKGNKGKYFCLSISFIGWALLAAIPASVISAIPAVLYAPVFVQQLVTAIADLCMVPVLVYIYSSTAGFYEILAGHLIKETTPAPVAPVAPAVPVETAAEITPEDAPQDPDDNLPKEV